jgi:serine/threonine protein kinase
VQLLAKFSHPNIIGFREHTHAPASIVRRRAARSNGDPRRFLRIVMDYAAGGDLAEQVTKQQRAKRPFDGARVVAWFVQLCLALKHMHDRKVLHRDIKTQNVFLTADHRVKLGDFGVCKTLAHTRAQARTQIGTPYYLSPELCAGKAYDYKSDVWSLGVLLYELLRLKHPFEGASMRALIGSIQRGTYAPVPPSAASAPLRALLSLMLRKRPSERPSIAAILATPFLKPCVQRFDVDVAAVATGVDDGVIAFNAKRRKHSLNSAPSAERYAEGVVKRQQQQLQQQKQQQQQQQQQQQKMQQQQQQKMQQQRQQKLQQQKLQQQKLQHQKQQQQQQQQQLRCKQNEAKAAAAAATAAAEAAAAAASDERREQVKADNAARAVLQRQQRQRELRERDRKLALKRQCDLSAARVRNDEKMAQRKAFMAAHAAKPDGVVLPAIVPTLTMAAGRPHVDNKRVRVRVRIHEPLKPWSARDSMKLPVVAGRGRVSPSKGADSSQAGDAGNVNAAKHSSASSASASASAASGEDAYLEQLAAARKEFAGERKELEQRRRRQNASNASEKQNGSGNDDCDDNREGII